MDSEMMNTPGLREEDELLKRDTPCNRRIKEMAEKAFGVKEERKQISVAEAVEVLIAELKKDKAPGSYYYSWQSNIACAIMDSFMDAPNPVDVPNWANEAAKKFLENLIS